LLSVAFSRFPALNEQIAFSCYHSEYKEHL